ncbi:PEP/pyruvate-binding domain-containing protein [Thalassomonas sp. RHCl1]|uniref:PEP/pyruvate-binding domain-containing protein n=1 Tax=Thalassomonas sp. RHCl1 TaxID=2995320 RepID=UPI00248ACA96|nr:PEP/pyruvate-binding domain-containing protein [Thalassomonas sp. RHCl1]
MRSRLHLALPLLCAGMMSAAQGSNLTSLDKLSQNITSQKQDTISTTVNDSESGADYFLTLASRTDFEALAARSDQPGAQSIREVKYLIMDVNTDNPKLYFFNTERYPYHYAFASEGLGYSGTLSEFNSTTYFHDDRAHLAGSILAHDHYSSEAGVDGLYTVQFWPVDPVTPELTDKAYKMIAEQMTFARDQIRYYPASDVQLDIYDNNLAFFESAEVPVIKSEQLFANIDFSILNQGQGYGRLRVINPGDPVPSVSDVVIYTYIPNDLAHVAGIITDSPQTPLSHINLKAKQNNTPNAYMRDAVNDPQVAPLIGELVKYEVTGDGIVLTAATQDEVDTWLESVRPDPQTPLSDLTVTEPALLSELGNGDWVRFGAKAANVAELANALKDLESEYGHQMVPRGYAVPFSMYNEYMSLPRCQELEEDDFGNLVPDGKYRALCDEDRATTVRNTDSSALSVSLLDQAEPITLAAGSQDMELVLDNANGLVLFMRDVTNDRWLLNPLPFTDAVLSASGSSEYRELAVNYLRENDKKTVTFSGNTDFELEIFVLALWQVEANLAITQTKDLPEDYFVERSYYQQIADIMADENFQASPDVRDAKLDDFRKEVKKGEVTAQMHEKLEAMRLFWDPQGAPFSKNIRLRSSTNNEDLAGFNGAGLYESNTHKPDEGDIADSVKKVWASLWTHRAFEERRFYRIDHFKTYMGVLVHESYGDEQANGVAVTKNIYDANWEGYYVNVQYGEISVTNPEPIITSEGEVSSVPDEFLLAHLLAGDDPYNPDHWWWAQQYIRHSNVETVYDQPVMTENVLTEAETVQLRRAMQAIQGHFKPVYDGDRSFAMDIEFKITATDDGSRGHLEVKQARPWID